MLNELGSYTKLIHSIGTTGFGKVFDWSHNVLSKSKNWKQFMLQEWDAYHRLEVLEKYKMLEEAQVKKIKSFLSKSAKWKDLSPHLNHGDIRLKNVIVDDRGKIVAIIDWEDSCSSIAPLWDFSIALHDLSVDEKQAFLKGYGISFDELRELSPALKVLNILNYATTIQGFADNKDKEMKTLYRLRLNGYLDLYTV